MAKEEDFIYMMVRGNSKILGVPFRVFHWTPDYVEDEDFPWVPVWMNFPRLPLNYFQESILRSIGDRFGKYLK